MAWGRIRTIIEPWRIAEFMSVVANLDIDPMPAKRIWNLNTSLLLEEERLTRPEVVELQDITIASKTATIPVDSHKIVFEDNGLIVI